MAIESGIGILLGIIVINILLNFPSKYFQIEPE